MKMRRCAETPRDCRTIFIPKLAANFHYGVKRAVGVDSFQIKKSEAIWTRSANDFHFLGDSGISFVLVLGSRPSRSSARRTFLGRPIICFNKYQP